MQPIPNGITEVQRTAIAKADASMRPALELYEERCKLMHRSFDRLRLEDLKRVNVLLAVLSDDDLRRIALYAEGLAEWRVIEAESPDAEAEV